MVHMVVKSPRAAVCVKKSTNSCQCFSRKSVKNNNAKYQDVDYRLKKSIKKRKKKKSDGVMGVGAILDEAAGGQSRMKSPQASCRSGSETLLN